jgi:hypothetical protein
MEYNEDRTFKNTAFKLLINDKKGETIWSSADASFDEVNFGSSYRADIGETLYLNDQPYKIYGVAASKLSVGWLLVIGVDV